ncbi:MAG: CobD/CbiB family protein [Betaproteobacteria bacterium]|nr:CobD/CbiB family protein [Betaproteobacteria bacterium]
MTLVSLIAALMLEQWRPVGNRNRAIRLFIGYADLLERQFNAGEHRHGAIAWLLAVVPAVVGAWLGYEALYDVSPALGWAWNVLLLYLTMGFRQFSHAFGEIAEALQAGELERARTLLGEWRGQTARDYSSNEVARVAIEQGLVYSHRYVFAVVLWFAVLPGPSGAVLYRLCEILAERWGGRREPEFGAFGGFSTRVFELLDWVPARLTAISFAIVGDFEDAIYCWRAQALSWAQQTQGIILASGAGALGVRLGESLRQGGEMQYRPELGVGDEADADYMQSTVGLIWRTVVLWLVLILLLTVASWVGS